MKKTLIFVVAIIVVATTLLLLPTPTNVSTHEGNSFILGPVQIFDGENVIPARYVEVREGYVSALHLEQPESDLRLVDGNNNWLLPGLIDSHVHAWGDALQQALPRGVTSVIDMFGDPAFLQEHTKHRDTASAENLSADIYGAGLLMTAPHGHGTQFGIAVSTLTSPEQAEALVAERVAEGSDFIKIVYTREGANYEHAPSISLQGLRASIAAAHQFDRLAVVHISDHASAQDAVEAGADGLVHSFFDRVISTELLEMMVENNVFVIPTMIVYEGMLRGEMNNEVLFNREDLNISRTAKATLNRNFASSRFPENFYDNLLTTTKRMHAAGIPVLAGSDAPNPNTAHGWSLLVELLLLKKAGLSPEATLQAATSVPADAFSLADRGRIATGRKADFILLPQSPIENLETILTPTVVWKNGYRIDIRT